MVKEHANVTQVMLETCASRVTQSISRRKMPRVTKRTKNLVT